MLKSGKIAWGRKLRLFLPKLKRIIKISENKNEQQTFVFLQSSNECWVDNLAAEMNHQKVVYY
jgi:hypothetical protein